jgi:hypothetical protein
MGTVFAADRVYPSLGFERYDYDPVFENAERRRGYVSDMALARHVIGRIEQSPQPLFVFAASMQGHGPYTRQNYPSYDVQIQHGFSRDTDNELYPYAQCVYEADKALAYLVEYFRRSGKPVLLVFYGDHLPALGSAFAETHYLPSTSNEADLAEQVRRYSTPALVWTNAKIKVGKIPAEVCPPILCSYIVRSLGFRHPFYTGFLSRMEAVTPAYSPAVVISPTGELRRSITGEPLFEDYGMIGYDLLFGKQYSLHSLFPDARQ